MAGVVGQQDFGPIKGGAVQIQAPPVDIIDCWLSGAEIAVARARPAYLQETVLWTLDVYSTDEVRRQLVAVTRKDQWVAGDAPGEIKRIVPDRVFGEHIQSLVAPFGVA